MNRILWRSNLKDMFKNIFKSTFRNIKRYSTWSILNIAGMSVAMTCVILILLWVRNECSYDRDFKNANDLYRIIEKQAHSGGETTFMVPVPGALVQGLKNDYPEIIRSSRFVAGPLTLKKGEEFIEENVTMIDKDFLDMFNIEFLQGDRKTALNDPHNIIMTEETARKFFGNGDALGRTLQSRGYMVTVTGIIKSLPSNCHFRFDYLVPIEWMSELGQKMNDWDHRFYIYIQLYKGSDGRLVTKKIKDYIKNNQKGSESEILLQNIKKIHLYSSKKYTYDISGQGDITNVRILSLVALFILLIACINFMNLSIAQNAGRASEIGIRKIAGAERAGIVTQFAGETIVIVFIAHVVAMILVELLLPGYNSLVGKQLFINYGNYSFYAGLFSLILLSGLLAASFPAYHLSSVNPVTTMKGMLNNNPGHIRFRRILVIFQFILSVILIISTFVIQRQLRYMQNKDLGFDRNNISYFMFPTRPGEPRLMSLKKELLGSPDIESVTMAWNPFYNESRSGGFTWKGKKEGEDILFHLIESDEDYARVYKLKMKEGRFFSEDFSTDSDAIVINEQAAMAMGFSNAIGETITASYGAKMHVIGVVQDFHFQSLHYKIEPLIMKTGPSNNFYVRMKQGKTAAATEFIKKAFKSFDPGLPIDLRFLDDDFNSLYRAEGRIGRIFGYFTLLAVIIACLGLMGLSSFMTERRTKEVGIRKINGAKSNEIFTMMAGQYIRWVLISIVIACPLAWYGMSRWLENFAYRLPISWWLFVLAGMLALIIAFLTVGFQSIRAANRNPVEALRYE